MKFNAASFVAGVVASALVGGLAVLFVSKSRDFERRAAIEAESRALQESTTRATMALERAVEQFEAEPREAATTAGPVRTEASRPSERSVAEDEAAGREVLAQLDDPFAILDAMEKGESPDRKLVEDPELFDRLFARTAPEKPLIGERLDPESAKTLPSGTTLSFGAGIFDLDLREPLRQNSPPSDFTVVGAGMDNTLLVGGDFSTGGKLRNFAIRDCTVFTDGDYLFDIRGSNDATITLDRVRVIGFDSGAGGSSALNVSANAMRVRDCIFESGYGRSTSHATLLDVRTPAMIARFERCRFVAISVELANVYSGWRVVFDRCHFEDLTNSDPSLPPGHHAGIEFFGCDFSAFDRTRGKPPIKDLSRLFPDWPRRTRR